jgi:hypothetical protein
MDTNFINAKAQLEMNGEIQGKTVGNSMLPLFRDNKDIVIIKNNNGNYNVNDVVLYRKKSTDEFILHRVLKVTDECLIIRGDNRFSKEYIPYEDTIGVMTAFERNGKYYDCSKSVMYKLYIIYIRASYPARRFLKKVRSFFYLLTRKPKLIIKKIFK